RKRKVPEGQRGALTENRPEMRGEKDEIKATEPNQGSNRLVVTGHVLRIVLGLPVQPLQLCLPLSQLMLKLAIGSGLVLQIKIHSASKSARLNHVCAGEFPTGTIVPCGKDGENVQLRLSATVGPGTPSSETRRCLSRRPSVARTSSKKGLSCLLSWRAL